MRTGEDFDIFQDREDILWGQNWKERIEESLDEVTFLIPVITPSFFKSENCRSELQRFLKREKKLGRSDLVLPVYYIDSSLLNDEGKRKTDELAQAVHAHQYADWRELRDKPLNATRILRTLGHLATQIREALERVQESRALGTLVETLPVEPAKEEATDWEEGSQKRSDKLLIPSNVDKIRPLLTLTGHGGVIDSVAFSPDGQLLASAGRDEMVRLWRVKDGSLLRTLEEHKEWRWVDSVAFSPDGQLLASAAADALVRLWRVEDGTLLRQLVGHGDAVTDLAFSPDGQLLVSGAYDRTVRLWRVQEGSLLHTLEHERGVGSVAFSPDGRLFASGGGDFRAEADNTVLLWRVRDRALLYAWEGHKGGVSGVAFSPNGQVLATCGGDRVVRLWRVEDGSLLRTLVGQDQDLRGIAFSPDGQLLASGAGDKTVRLWRAQDGALLATLKGHKDKVRDVAFSPSGQLLASSAADLTVQLWGA